MDALWKAISDSVRKADRQQIEISILRQLYQAVLTQNQFAIDGLLSEYREWRETNGR